MTAIADLPPGLLMMIGALFLPLLAKRMQAWTVLALSALSLALFILTPSGDHGNLTLFGAELHLVRIDSISRPFAIVFHLAAIISAIYALHVRDPRQHVAGALYSGAAIAAACAGDLLTLFVFWELTAISSVFLIWASDNERSYRAGMRYLIIQVTSGVLLLSGAIVQYVETGSLSFTSFFRDQVRVPAVTQLVAGLLPESDRHGHRFPECIHDETRRLFVDPWFCRLRAADLGGLCDDIVPDCIRRD